MKFSSFVAMTICLASLTIQGMQQSPKVKFTYIPGIGTIQEMDPNMLSAAALQAEQDYAMREAALAEARRQEAAQALLRLNPQNNQ